MHLPQRCTKQFLPLEPKDDPMTGATWSDVKFLTIYELAVMMRISKMSAYRLVRTGELEAIRVGRSYRIPEQAVLSYMRDAAFTPTGIASLHPPKSQTNTAE
jgi:excisionase family DNA binding protein